MRKEQKKIAIGVGIAFAVLIIVAEIVASFSELETTITSLFNNQVTTTTTSNTATELGSKENPAEINDTVTIDEVKFTVTGINNTLTQVGLEKAKEGGRFVIVSMIVENKAKGSQMIGTFNFKLLDTTQSGGVEYDPSNATIYLNEGFFLSKSLKPNLPTPFYIAFDVKPPLSNHASYLMEITRTTFGINKYISIGTVW